jgi:hypothetical protein
VASANLAGLPSAVHPDLRRLATEPNDLDREFHKGSCAAYEWFGFRGRYKRDTVFHITFGRDQLAKCSFSSSRAGSLSKYLLQVPGCPRRRRGILAPS